MESIQVRVERQRRPGKRLFLSLVLVLAGVRPAPARSQAVEPAVYQVSFPSPEEHIAAIKATLPTRGKTAVDVMMPVWSPGYYRVEDYAAQVRDLAAYGPGGQVLEVRRIPPNRWRIQTGGVSPIVVSYRLSCTRYFVTTNWVSPDLGVLNGPATFITPVDDAERPQQVQLELPSSWPRVATGLTPAPDGNPHHYQAKSYDELVDAPIVAGDLRIHEFVVQGVPHYLADAGAPEGWDGEKVAGDLGRIVEQTLPLWGTLPYAKYVFLNVFRQGAGGLEHGNSTLLTTSPQRVATKRAYDAWLGFAAHEYVHAFNVKRLRPVELGPFDYEAPPRTSSLWLAEGVTSYLANLAVTRAGLTTAEDFLGSLSGTIRQLQESPGRLLQTLEQSSLEVWTNSNSGVGAAPTTVSYYVKGEVVGFLLDARVREATGGRRSLDDVMHTAYLRYGGERGYTPEEFRAIAEEVAGTDLEAWFRRAVASTEELDYSEALEWFGLRFAADGTWSLGIRDDATPDQAAHLRDLLEADDEKKGPGAERRVKPRARPLEPVSSRGVAPRFRDPHAGRLPRPAWGMAHGVERPGGSSGQRR